MEVILIVSMIIMTITLLGIEAGVRRLRIEQEKTNRNLEELLRSREG